MVAVPIAGFGVAMLGPRLRTGRSLLVVAQRRQHGRTQSSHSSAEKKTSKSLSLTYGFNLIADTNYFKTLSEQQVMLRKFGYC